MVAEPEPAARASVDARPLATDAEPERLQTAPRKAPPAAKIHGRNLLPESHQLLPGPPPYRLLVEKYSPSFRKAMTFSAVVQTLMAARLHQTLSRRHSFRKGRRRTCWPTLHPTDWTQMVSARAKDKHPAAAVDTDFSSPILEQNA